MVESQQINPRLDGQTGKPCSREVWIDILKAITFFLVPFGHSALPRPFGGPAVNVFHMPMFFLISGYLMKPGEGNGLVKKQAKSLLIPYYLTCLALMLWSIYDAVVWNIDLRHRLSIQIPAALYGAGSNRYCILPEGIYSIGPCWFLWGFFFSYLIVSHVKDHKYGFWICAGCSYLAWKSAQSIYLPLSIQGGMYGSIFMYLGYMGKKFDYLDKIGGGNKE